MKTGRILISSAVWAGVKLRRISALSLLAGLAGCASALPQVPLPEPTADSGAIMTGSILTAEEQQRAVEELLKAKDRHAADAAREIEGARRPVPRAGRFAGTEALD